MGLSLPHTVGLDGFISVELFRRTVISFGGLSFDWGSSPVGAKTAGVVQGCGATTVSRLSPQTDTGPLSIILGVDNGKVICGGNCSILGAWTGGEGNGVKLKSIESIINNPNGYRYLATRRKISVVTLKLGQDRAAAPYVPLTIRAFPSNAFVCWVGHCGRLFQ